MLLFLRSVQQEECEPEYRHSVKSFPSAHSVPRNSPRTKVLVVPILVLGRIKW